MTQDGPSIQLMIERGGLPPLRGFVAGRRPDGRPLGPEGLDVSGVHLRPALARPPGRPLALQVAGEQVEALVPAGAVPGRLADLVDRVQQVEAAIALRRTQ